MVSCSLNKRCTARALALFAGLAGIICSLTAPSAARSQENPDVQTWPFQYQDDAFRSDAVLDLRYLNEKTAGESGFIKLTADGSGFELGNGAPVRFWAVGSDVYRRSPEEMARHARFLAKLGVNMVRLHTQIAPDGGLPITAVNQKEIDGIWHFVAAMKREGIYTTISPYWASTKDATNWGITGYEGKTELWGLLFFDERLQAGYKAWVKALYAPVNPYTGIPLARDPSVGIIQVQNEDGMFFWTMQGLKPEQQRRLGVKFGQWLVKKYGSLDKAKQSWGGAGNDKDNFAEGLVGLNDTYQMTQIQPGGWKSRVDDQTEFYAETQRKFYADIVDYYRNTLGCRQLINASNWITADPIKLNDLERWTYTAADVVAVNKYYNGGTHIGDNNGWRIDPGHYFTDISALQDPRDLPTNLKQVVGHPTIITESTWVSPLGYQSEGPFLMGAYEALTGVNTFYWFSADAPTYEPNPYFTFLNLNGQHPLYKWSASIPAIMSQFPANALVYREGYVRRAETVVHEERSLADMWARKTPIIAEDKSFDPNRNSGSTTEQSNIAKGVDPLAFLVGRVEVKYGGDPSKDHVVDLSQYIDHQAEKVKSATGEVSLDYGKGLCVVDAPKAQGVCGFLNKFENLHTADLTVRSRNAYATIMAVTMDDRPLKSSHKILVQVGTNVRPTGWETKQADFKSEDGKQTFHGFEITNTGTMPWLVADSESTLTIDNAALTKAVVLDTAGYSVREIPLTASAGSVTLRLPSNALYIVLE